MRPAPLLVGGVVLLAGCLGLPSHEDRTTFFSKGSFELAVAAGAKVLQAREDPGERGHFYPSLPMATPDLDMAWGEGRYALESIHWWGPPGPPAAASEGDATLVDSSDIGWQGFSIARGSQVQVLLGDIPPDTARGWYDDFLVNVTSLDAQRRQEAVDHLFEGCGGHACAAPVPDGVDASGVWQRLGGLDVSTAEGLHPSSGRLVIGAWWFWFEWHEAMLERGLSEQTILRVGSNDVGEFVWQSDRTHSDEASWQKLVETVRDVGITPPDPAGVAWRHQEIYYD